MKFIIILIAAWAVFTAGALMAAKMIGKRSWRDTIRWMFEFFS
ncbi:MAG TPA: hypothetical protein VJM83_01165 [Nitrospirota bacterium]|nr:hypothetical protein [Nitrospirota bacterium]